MTTEKAYASFIIKINENATNDGLACDKGRFTILFNESQNRLIEHILDKKFEDDIRYIQKILVDDFTISSSNSHLDHQDFILPTDYFDYSSSYALASKGSCTSQKIDLFEIKDDDRNLKLRSENLKPSFRHRETLFNLSSNKIKVYTNKEFKIDSLILSYYRYPVQIGLKDQDDPESTFSTADPEFDDKFVNRVISLAASRFLLNSDDEKYQAEKIEGIQKA